MMGNEDKSNNVNGYDPETEATEAEYQYDKARHDWEEDMKAGLLKTYDVLVKSHCEAPDFETEITARNKAEAIEILRKKYDYDFNEDDLDERRQ